MAPRVCTTLLLWAALAACGGPVKPAERPAGGTAADAPLTDRDPPPWVPTPGDQPHTGSATAVATSGGYDQARGVAIRFVQAIRDADEATLERLLAERVGRVFPRLGTPNRSRSDFIASVLRNPRLADLGPEVPLDQLIDPAGMEVTPLVRREDAQPIPAGLAGSDLLVTFPLQTRGRRLRFLLGWPSQGGLVIRPGVEPQIVAI